MKYVFLLLLLPCLRGVTQVNTVETLNQLAAKILREYSTEAKELVALKTDKTAYRAGSQIWFRAFTVSSNGFPVSLKSKMIFVDLVNEKDSSLDRVLLNADSLRFDGAIQVPGNIPEGFYQLRAYTKEIIQEYPVDIFISTIYIVNNLKAETKTGGEEKNSSESYIKLYPEGNNLVNGVSNTVFYTSVDKYGLPVPVKGVVKDNRDTTVQNFSDEGIGRFSFEPYTKDRTYKVHIKNNNGTEQVYQLPAIKTGAYQLSLQQKTNDQLIFRIALGDSVYKKKAASYLLGIAGGTVGFASAGTGMYMVNVPLKNFPSGIADFWLFDENQVAVSRCSVFIDSSNAKISVSADRPDYLARQKAKISIQVTDKEGQPVRAVLAVSITDNAVTEKRPSIHSAHLFLLSRNSYGLNPAEKISNQQINYADIFATISANGHFLRENPVINTDNNFYWDGLELKGRIADNQNNGLVRELVILSPDQEKNTYQDSTDNNGVFLFRDIVFYGNRRFHVLVPAIYNNQKKYDIIHDPVKYPVIRTAAFLNSTVPASLSSALAEFKKQHADSSITGSTPQWLNQIALQAAGGNKNSKTQKKGLSPHRVTAETLDKLGLSNTVDAVKLLPGVMMMNNRLTIRGGIQSMSGSLSNVEPLLLIDGVPVNATSVVDYLNSISPSNIEYIEVLTGPEAAMYGSRSGNGVISVKTANQLRVKQGNDGRDAQTILAKGYHQAPAFQMPSYDTDAIREAAFNDNRSTIYWNGELITGNTGKTEFSFYTANPKNNYTLIVEGITEKGELIRQEFLIKRK